MRNKISYVALNTKDKEVFLGRADKTRYAYSFKQIAKCNGWNVDNFSILFVDSITGVKEDTMSTMAYYLGVWFEERQMEGYRMINKQRVIREAFTNGFNVSRVFNYGGEDNGELD